MITDFKIFESIWDIPDEMVDTPEGFKRCLSAHISGVLPIKDSYKLVESAQFFFKWKIPNSLKYEGSVYRVMQFHLKERYNEILKNGIKPFELQRYWSCAKDLKSIEKVKYFTTQKNFKYFITFKFDVTYNDVLFDMNKMNEHLDLPDSYYEENEIIVLTSSLPEITSKNIVDHGKLK